MKKLREWAMGVGLLTGLGAAGLSSQENAEPQPKRPDTISTPVPFDPPETQLPRHREKLSDFHEDRQNLDDTDEPNEGQTYELQVKKDGIIALTEEIFEEEVIGGKPEKGLGYMSISSEEDGVHTEGMKLFWDGQDLVTITFEEDGYTLKTGIGEREVSVETLKELGDVIAEYRDNLSTFEVAYDVNRNQNADLLDQSLESLAYLEHTHYFKSTN